MSTVITFFVLTLWKMYSHPEECTSVSLRAERCVMTKRELMARVKKHRAADIQNDERALPVDEAAELAPVAEAASRAAGALVVGTAAAASTS